MQHQIIRKNEQLNMDIFQNKILKYNSSNLRTFVREYCLKQMLLDIKGINQSFGNRMQAQLKTHVF